jgi:hypothetical protein
MLMCIRRDTRTIDVSILKLESLRSALAIR